MNSDINVQAKRGMAELVERSLKKRYRAERLFRLYGMASVLVAIVFLAFLLLTILSAGLPAFKKTYIRLDIAFDPAVLEITDIKDEAQRRLADYNGLIRQALQSRFPEVRDRREKRRLYSLISSGAEYQLGDMLQSRHELLNTKQSVWLYADNDVDALYKTDRERELPEAARRINDLQLTWLARLEAEGAVKTGFNWNLLNAGDSREPELAGIRGALVGSFYTLLVTLLLSFPIGVAAAIYLEEYAPRNRWTDIIEVNINNLAAVPSIVFGLLGLAVFINFFSLPRSAPLVGGLVLTLMTLPTIIIASRSAIKAVPPSIRQAALGVGASKMQTVLHHVLPLALPGMLTGTIIGMARALGETAPLLMIGMVAFIVDVPRGFADPATVLPVQIFLWADSPERGFTELTSAAIIVLLVFLVVMNLLAVILRRKFERRW
ncbi:MAG TPA: phosphate ABC transporter permease PstA [Gammaproteobacteria bacterium]|nr:phosphate ABC transporter permease PstA [Gammaproteobacteria bacterium]